MRTGLLPYLKYRSFWAMCLGWMGFNGVFYGLLTWGPLYLSESKGFDIATIGWSTLVIFGAGFVGELIGGWTSDRWKAKGAGANTVMRTMMGVAGIAVVSGLLGVVLVPDAMTAVALLSVVLFFLRWAGLYWSLPSVLAGRANAGVVGGAMNLSGNIAGMITPIAVGFIVGATAKPLVHGHEVDLVEFCGNWYVDDLPPMMFNKHAHNSQGYVSPRQLEQDWRDQFDWVHRELDYAVLPITLHPDVSGRPQVLLMLERFIEYVSGHEGVSFCTLEDAADDFRRRFPFGSAERPADMR